jgi:hypothetical protein
VESVGKLMVIAGLALVVVGGLVWIFGPKLGAGGGLLPGDISLRRGNFSFHFPLVTCLVVSVVLTLLLRLFQK